MLCGVGDKAGDECRNARDSVLGTRWGENRSRPSHSTTYRADEEAVHKSAKGSDRVLRAGQSRGRLLGFVIVVAAMQICLLSSH
jgi:hypothetical protein